MPLLGLLAAPITLTAGSVVSFEVLIWLAFPLSATAAFFVLRRWSGSNLGAACGGLLYGFSPYMVGEGFRHLNLAFVPLPPLIFYAAVVILVEQRPNPWRWGVVLGILVTAQYLISPEVLSTTLVVAACAVAILAVARRRAVDRRPAAPRRPCARPRRRDPGRRARLARLRLSRRAAALSRSGPGAGKPLSDRPARPDRPDVRPAIRAARPPDLRRQVHVRLRRERQLPRRGAAGSRRLARRPLPAGPPRTSRRGPWRPSPSCSRSGLCSWSPTTRRDCRSPSTRSGGCRY